MSQFGKKSDRRSASGRFAAALALSLAVRVALGELFPPDDLAGLFGQAGARSWDSDTRLAYIAKPDADWDGLNDEEERACIAFWGEVEKNAFSWHDGAGAGTFTNLSSAGFEHELELPFAFHWGSNQWNKVRVCRNGVLSFSGIFPEDAPMTPLPLAPSFGTFLLPCWHDGFLYTAPECRYWAFAPADASCFVVCWENLAIQGSPGSKVSFQVEMRPDGEMIWRYRDRTMGTGTPAYGLIGAQKDGGGWSLPCDMLHESVALRVMPMQWSNADNPDSDGDNIIDGIEFYYYDPGRGAGRELNPSVSDNPGDIDRDGLDVTEEFLHGQLDPFYWDTDGDMLGDGYEVAHRLLAYDANGIHGLEGDADGDGLTNRMERLHRTHPRRVDTDRDGIDDTTEVASYSNPAGSGEIADLRLLVPVRFTLGDPGFDGLTEAYVMMIDPIAGDTRAFTFQNTIYGSIQTNDLNVSVGGRYKLTLDHLGSVRSSNLLADPDYEAGVEALDDTIIIVDDEHKLLERHLSPTNMPPGMPPVDTNIFARLWVVSSPSPDGGPPIADPQFTTRIDAWPAGRAAAAGPIPAAENATPGVLVLPPSYAPVMGTIIPAKLRLNGIAQEGAAMTRWLHFSDPARVSYRLPGGSFAAPLASEVQVPGSASMPVDIELQSAGVWPAGTSVDVKCLIKTTGGQVVSESAQVRLLGQAVVAIGDSITYGVRRTRDGKLQTPLWGNPWGSYPTASAWSGYAGTPTDINYQGSRGFLRRDLTYAIPWVGHDTNGHGSEHCGYPGARTGHINNMLVDSARTFPRAAVQSGPGVLVIVYFIGINDAGAGHSASSIYSSWKTGLDRILSQRVGRGRTLIVAVTLPDIRSDYRGYSSTRQSEQRAFNARVRRHSVSAPYTRYVVADIENVGHDWDDDGLHFMAGGYGRIEEKIRAAILSGLRSQP